jgi:UDP-N-acetylmuramoyl-tripeptide--D-alanyl-D-alanine ligase
MMASQIGSCLLIDDTYNANPDSVRAAIDALSRASQKTCLVLGDMGEVGSKGPEFHYEVGTYAAECGVTNLLTLGSQAAVSVEGFNEVSARLGRTKTGLHFSTKEELTVALVTVIGRLSQGSAATEPFALLVKGSRFMRMEQVLEAIRPVLMEASPCS